MSDLETMIREARAAQARSYSPYSHFPVGACLRGESGRLFTGCNVENASYPEGWCAETSAIAAMVLAGDHRIEAIVVVAESDPACPPCGGCRQRLAEFAAPTTPVHMVDLHGEVTTTTLGDLLPHAFSSRQLESVPRR